MQKGFTHSVWVPTCMHVWFAAPQASLWCCKLHAVNVQTFPALHICTAGPNFATIVSWWQKNKNNASSATRTQQACTNTNWGWNIHSNAVAAGQASVLPHLCPGHEVRLLVLSHLCCLTSVLPHLCLTCCSRPPGKTSGSNTDVGLSLQHSLAEDQGEAGQQQFGYCGTICPTVKHTCRGAH